MHTALRCASLIVAITVVLMPVAAQGPGTLLAIANAGFEAPAIAAGTFSTLAPPPGWAAFGNLNFNNRTIGVLRPATTTLYAVPVPEGHNVGVAFLMDSFANQSLFTNQPAGLQQTLVDVLRIHTRYTLRVQVGNIANDPSPGPNQFQFGGFPRYRIDLLAGASVIASDQNTLLPGEGLFLESTVVAEIGAVHPLAGAPLGIRLVNLNAAVGIEVNFDDVRLQAVDTAAWSDVGNALAGSVGVPRLVGGGTLAGGSQNQLDLTRGLPSSLAYLVFGLSAANTPLLGGVLVPSPLFGVVLPLDAAGTASHGLQWPAGWPGVTLYLQAWILDPAAANGVSASNGLLGLSI